MNIPYIHTSLTRIAPLDKMDYQIQPVPREAWKTGDYILGKVIFPGSQGVKLELISGRMVECMKDDQIVGALGDRFATLEATGSWREIGDDLRMHCLTGAGLLGKLTSKSTFLGEPIQLDYQGHLFDTKGIPLNMPGFVEKLPEVAFDIPVILLAGTSMSAGKTTAGRIITRQLKRAGLKVVAAKLTGAGRYRDILSMRDVGADYIFDFVDVGLPSSIVPLQDYQPALKQLLTRIQNTQADVALIEIGASPLEPYNGVAAIRAIQDQIRFRVLCASDPYSVLGVMKSFGMKPDLVSGVATNTLGGIQLIEKLCQIKAINMIDPLNLPELRDMLGKSLGVNMAT
jgi:hypothetical protein